MMPIGFEIHRLHVVYIKFGSDLVVPEVELHNQGRSFSSFDALSTG